MSLTVAETTSSISSGIAAATRSQSLLHRYRIGSGYRRPFGNGALARSLAWGRALLAVLLSGRGLWSDGRSWQSKVRPRKFFLSTL